MLSLGGLTIAIGRIVDDSIVVIENVERHMRYGKSRRDTIVDAVREVGAAITASTITTVAVFLPIALVGGMSGVLFRPFAFTVTVAMLASLLVALTIVPVLAYWFLKWRGAHDADDAPQARDELTEEAATQGWIQRGYARLLDWVIARRWTTMGIAVVVLLGTVALSPLIKTNFLGDLGQNEVGVTQEVEPGTSLDDQLTQAQDINDALLAIDGVERVATTIGGDEETMLFGGTGNAINYTVTTDEDGDHSAIEEEIRATLASLIDEDDLTILPIAGMGVSNDIEIGITGAEVDQVEAA